MIGSNYFEGFFSDQSPPVNADAEARFFNAFRRFEYALKAAGYLEKRNRASPDWKTFRTEVKDNYVSGKNDELDNAVAYLREKPVGWQLPLKGKPAFKPISREGQQTDIEFAIQSVEVIRGNLVHGGKFPSDPERDSELFTCGIVILAQCLEWNENVRYEFFKKDKEK